MRAGGMAVGSEQEPELAGVGDTEVGDTEAGAGAATVSVVTRHHSHIT